MSVTLHQPVAGLVTGDTYSGPMEDWLVAQGYARDGEPTDMVNLVDVTEDKNPQLAEHREAPGEDPKLFGSEVPVKDNAVELGDPVSNPPQRQINALGAKRSDEDKKLADELDGRVDEVSEEPPPLQVAAVEKAEEVAGTGDHLLNEPTDEVAPADAPAPRTEAKATPKAKPEPEAAAPEPFQPPTRESVDAPKVVQAPRADAPRVKPKRD